MKKFSLLSLLLLLSSCTPRDPNLAPVSGFDLNRYLGTWYEIARLDHRFEKGLTQVKAEYTLRPDGKVDVLNSGLDAKSSRWKTAKGVAKFSSDPQTGELKVSFFRPFYGNYVILELDQEKYDYALVCGGNTKYLWILSRTPILDKPIVDRLVEKAKSLGFPTGELIFPQ
ncbi:MAG TPA: lipocalin family protein [Elusimicrobiales bacterium]|nr:lipocalin family protein [Elusimicrobiales bacterium]